MTIIKKKILPEYFELIKSGKKKFELRLADFDVKEGDTLILEEWTGLGADRKPTGRTIEKKVGYVLKFDLDKFGQKEAIEKHGLYVLGLE